MQGQGFEPMRSKCVKRTWRWHVRSISARRLQPERVILRAAQNRESLPLRQCDQRPDQGRFSFQRPVQKQVGGLSHPTCSLSCALRQRAASRGAVTRIPCMRVVCNRHRRTKYLPLANCRLRWPGAARRKARRPRPWRAPPAPRGSARCSASPGTRGSSIIRSSWPFPPLDASAFLMILHPADWFRLCLHPPPSGCNATRASRLRPTSWTRPGRLRRRPLQVRFSSTPA